MRHEARPSIQGAIQRAIVQPEPMPGNNRYIPDNVLLDRPGFHFNKTSKTLRGPEDVTKVLPTAESVMRDLYTKIGVDSGTIDQILESNASAGETEHRQFIGTAAEVCGTEIPIFERNKKE